ncbi:MAG: hypothetical protein BWY83_03318 [bacterium ADurb.Bin478]|nr:MAG: hypothetical protein BWY83_03318 [bacterium ADurb.Bin478]
MTLLILAVFFGPPAAAMARMSVMPLAIEIKPGRSTSPIT